MIEKFGCLAFALIIAVNLAWWGFIVWAIYTLVTHFAK